jgi:hypothetical protein
LGRNSTRNRIRRQAVKRGAFVWAGFTYEWTWSGQRESKPLRAFRDFAQFQHKTAAVCALYDSVQFARFAESRTITQFPCPNLSENFSARNQG